MLIGVCDDDLNVIQDLSIRLEDYFSSTQYDVVIQGFQQPQKLLLAAQERHFDILFIDIMLDNEHGVNIAGEIRQSAMNEYSAIYYISSIEDYSNKLISTRPEEYLLKPITDNRLFRALDRLLISLELKNDSIHISFNQGSVKLFQRDILYVESIGRKSLIHTQGKKYAVYRKLNDIASDLNSFYFLEIHKSYLINVRQLSVYHYDQLILIDGTILPVSQSKQKKVRSFIMEFIKSE